MPMPTVNDLQTMYGAWNPQAYMQAQENAGLARQMEEQNLAQEREATRKAGLDNMFLEQDNPNRVRERVITNEGRELENIGRGHDNIVKGVNANHATKTAQFNLDEAGRKAALGAKDHEIKMGEAEAQRLMMSMDPAQRQQGEQLYAFTKHVRDLQMKHANDMEKERYTQQQTTGRHVETLANQRQIEGMRQEGQTSRAAAKGTGGNWLASLRKLKTPEQATELARVLTMGLNPDTGQPLTDLERQGLETQYRQATINMDAKPNPTSGIDLGLGPDGKPKIVNKEDRPSTNILNKEKEKPKLPSGWVQKN